MCPSRLLNSEIYFSLLLLGFLDFTSLIRKHTELLLHWVSLHFFLLSSYPSYFSGVVEHIHYSFLKGRPAPIQISKNHILHRNSSAAHFTRVHSLFTQAELFNLYCAMRSDRNNWLAVHMLELPVQLRKLFRVPSRKARYTSWTIALHNFRGDFLVLLFVDYTDYFINDEDC